LLPESWETPLTWEDIVRQFYPQEIDEPQVENGEWDGSLHMDDDSWKVAFPARTKTDLAIRRTRFQDAVDCCYIAGEVLGKLHESGWDYIAAMNVLWAVAVRGREWWDRWAQVGVWRCPPAQWAKVVKEVSNMLKVKNNTVPDWRMYAENAGLTGYRNPPYPGFDAVVETRRLAEVETAPHQWEAGEFEQLARDTLKMAPPPVDYVPFRQWVESGVWTTAGASSIGRVEWRAGDEKGKFKARKNVAVGVVDLQDLAMKAEVNRSQVNVAIVKSELGKLRMAVSSDLETYLQQTWINSLLGHAYLQWAGNTIEEGVEEQTDRMIEMAELTTRKTGMPFDYAAFDHQPTMDEIKTIVRVLIDHARVNVPGSHIAEFNAIAARVVAAFDDASLAVPKDVGSTKFKVTGGLMSGLRWTSVVGNAWNTVVTAMAEKCYRSLGGQGVVQRWIRGDDSAIYADSWGAALAMKIGYDGLGVDSGDGKFSIRKDAMEFLRVWYDEDGCSGYPMRSIPGLTQRKPWTSAPWTEVGTWRALRDTLSTIQRRTGDSAETDAIWRHLSRRWAQLHRLPQELLAIPEPLGGYGVGEWDGVSRTSKPAPTVESVDVDVINSTGWLGRKKAAHLQEEFSISLDAQDIKLLDKREFQKRMRADSVPEYARQLRTLWKEAVSAWEGRIYKVEREKVVKVGATQRWLFEALPVKGWVKEWKSRCKPFARLWGAWRRLEERWRDAQEAKEFGFNPRNWFSIHEPDFWDALSGMEKKGLHRAEALDWLFGRLSIGYWNGLHPASAVIIRYAVAAAIGNPVWRRWNKNRWYETVNWVSEKMVGTLMESKLYKFAFSW
jgi:hypothetical protein